MRSWPWQNRHRGARIALIALGVLSTLVLVGFLAAPSIVKRVVNHKLQTMPGGYQGTIEDARVALFAGEVHLERFRIVKKNGLVPVPFMQMKELVLGFELDGWRMRNTLRFVEPNAQFVDAESEARKQKGPEHQLDRLQGQLPFMLKTVTVQDGQFHFRNFQTKPDLDVYARDIDLVWDHLVGCLPPGRADCRSSVRGDAKVMKSGTLKLQGDFARSPQVVFHASASLIGQRLPEINQVLQHYAKIDFQNGTASVEARLHRRGDNQDIVLTPYLHDVKVVGSDDKEKTSFIREMGVAAAAGFFERRQGAKAVKIKIRPGKHAEFLLVDVDEDGDQKGSREQKEKDKG